MDRVAGAVGNIAGVIGILFCVVSGLGRMSGVYHLGGFESQTVFAGGVALMVLACLAKLQVLTTKH